MKTGPTELEKDEYGDMDLCQVRISANMPT